MREKTYSEAQITLIKEREMIFLNILEERTKHKSLSKFHASMLSAGGIYSSLFSVLFEGAGEEVCHVHSRTVQSPLIGRVNLIHR